MAIRSQKELTVVAATAPGLHDAAPEHVAHTDSLTDVITAELRMAGAVVTSTERVDPAPEEGWTLRCAGPDETIGGDEPLRPPSESDHE
ncbi:peptidoglycan-binding lysin domain-containing protein [Streptomyces laurentii]|uniref:Peptidoglycan-binding lysin domain-containing protein n=1 Tax=Streptomyces laurentii TaxID=39478 RepID=A0A169PL78_STRLU|nr:peptidoglycan-binding lysin domain-containing protein [Streptomyces laurentii]